FLAPSRKRPIGGFNRLARFRGAKLRHASNNFPRRRIVNLNRAPGLCLHPRAIDVASFPEQSRVLHLCCNVFCFCRRVLHSFSLNLSPAPVVSFRQPTPSPLPSRPGLRQTAHPQSPAALECASRCKKFPP